MENEIKITENEHNILHEQMQGLLSRVARTGANNRWKDLVQDKIVEAAGWLHYWYRFDNPIQMGAKIDFAKTEKEIGKN